jgi:hypothetical protein
MKSTIADYLRKLTATPKIYVDMDGVLTDFKQAVTNLGVAEGLKKDAPKEDKDAMYGAITDAGTNFWTNMYWCQGAKEMWDYLKQFNPTILSSPGTEGKFKENAMSGKKSWVNNNIPGTPLFLEEDKYQYADRDAILIDDMPKNIDAWISHGGIGILHEDPPTTLIKLKRLLNTPNMQKTLADLLKEQIPTQ